MPLPASWTLTGSGRVQGRVAEPHVKVSGKELEMEAWSSGERREGKASGSPSKPQVARRTGERKGPRLQSLAHSVNMRHPVPGAGVVVSVKKGVLEVVVVSSRKSLESHFVVPYVGWPTAGFFSSSQASGWTTFSTLPHWISHVTEFWSVA